MPIAHSLRMRLPLFEMGTHGILLSTVRRRYEAYRSTGLSVQQATRETEKELGISDVRTSPDGKDVVYFKEDATPMSEGRRAEDEKDWLASHPGYEFGVYLNGKLNSSHPSLPIARREAKKHTGQGKEVRIKDVHKPDRSYWHEEVEEEE